MLKVMIVDDEIIVRVGFQSCIRWTEYGCEVIATCASGKEAIDSFVKEVPDIVFTDIMMPEMNGIELVKYIRNYYPKTKVVVLSCINEIEYVKQAIKFGAEDYILKLSFTPAALADILVKLTESIENERRIEGIDSVYTDMKSFSREEGFKRFLQMDISVDEQGELLDKLGIQYDPFKRYMILCILIDDFKNTYGYKESDSYIMKNGLLNIAREYMGKLADNNIYFTEVDEISLIFSYQDSEKNIVDTVENSFELLNHALKTHLNITVSGGLSVDIKNRLDIANGYKKAEELAKLRFFSGKASFHKKIELADETLSTKRSMQKKLQKAIFKQSPDEAYELLDEWFDQMRICRTYSQAISIKHSVVETWIFISGYSLPENADSSDFEDNGFIKKIWEFETIDELKEEMKTAIQLLLSYLMANKTGNSEIKSFLSYLDDHINENITLEEAAERCALSRSQFCILFKKAVGETFINYFNGKKMEKAFRYLSSENILVQEAAYRVGIKDISYFNKMFRKYYKMSPSEVKKIGK